MGDPPENGNTLRWRVQELEKARDQDREATRLLAEFGAKHNEQINTVREDVGELKEIVKEIPVLRTEVANLLDGWRAVRNAFLAAAGGLLILAGTIIYQAAQ